MLSTLRLCVMDGRIEFTPVPPSLLWWLLSACTLFSISKYKDRTPKSTRRLCVNNARPAFRRSALRVKYPAFANFHILNILLHKHLLMIKLL